MTDNTQLYRQFNRDGKLLYVGISINAFERFRQHAKDKTWIDTVASMTIEHFASRQEALDAERAAIESECPLWNIVFNRGIQSKSKKANKSEEKKPNRKIYSYEVESNVAYFFEKQKYTTEEINKNVKLFWNTQKRISGSIKEDFPQTFAVGQRFYKQLMGGVNSRWCELFTITAIEDGFFVVNYDNGKEESFITGNFFNLQNIQFIDEEYYELNEKQKEKYEGINIKKSLEICGYDPRHFSDRILGRAQIVAHCKGCNSEQKGFLGHYYERNDPDIFGKPKKECEWHW